MKGYEIWKLSQGGFVVRDAPFNSADGKYNPCIFASTTIDAALDFIKTKIMERVA